MPQDADRQSRLEAVRRQQQRSDRARSAAIWGSAALVIVAIAGAVAFAIIRDQRSRPDLSAVSTFTVSQGHVTTPVTYKQTPPAGGEHAPVWVNCAQYSEPVPNENAVHSLEHGAVWITYRPDLPAAGVKTLQAATPDTYAILSPYADLPAPVVVSAWGKQLRLTGADDPRLAAFIRAYRQGGVAPEVGASCTGGLDPSTGAGGAPMPAPTTSSAS